MARKFKFLLIAGVGYVMVITIVETIPTKLITNVTNFNVEATNSCALTAPNASQKNGNAILTKIVPTALTKIALIPLAPAINFAA